MRQFSEGKRAGCFTIWRKNQIDLEAKLSCNQLPLSVNFLLSSLIRYFATYSDRLRIIKE